MVKPEPAEDFSAPEAWPAPVNPEQNWPFSLQRQFDNLGVELVQLNADEENRFSVSAVESVNHRIQHLSLALGQSQGVQRYDYEEISRNPLQPRTIFPESEIETLAHVLEEEGQLTPGILIEMTHEIRLQLLQYAERGYFALQQPLFNLELPYLLFDGERRWRAGRRVKQAGRTDRLNQFEAVLLPGGRFVQDLLELQAKAASTSIHQKKLHPLEMAQFLIMQIDYRYPQLRAQHPEPGSVVYPRILNRLIVRMAREDKRQGSKRVAEMNRLAIASRTEQTQWLDTCGDETERAILDVLFRHQQTPAKVNRHIFPLLKLEEDLKQAIWTSGLESEKVNALKRLNAQNLHLPETDATQIRMQVTEEAIANRWNANRIQQRIAEILQDQHPNSGSTRPVRLPKAFHLLEKVDLMHLSAAELHQCEQLLSGRLKEIKRLLKGSLQDPK